MEQTIKELAGDLAVIHESLERAEAVERQLGKYWREHQAERDQLRAEAERLRGLLCAECGGTGEIDSGICFCGDDYNSHTVGHGHAPVDCPQQCGTCAKKERMIECRGAYRELQRIVGEDCGIVFAGDLPHVCRETLEERILELQQEEGTIWA